MFLNTLNPSLRDALVILKHVWAGHAMVLGTLARRRRASRRLVNCTSCMWLFGVNILYTPQHSEQANSAGTAERPREPWTWHEQL